MALKLAEKDIDELSKSIAQAYVSRTDIQKAQVKVFIDTYMDVYEAARNSLKAKHIPKKMEWEDIEQPPKTK